MNTIEEAIEAIGDGQMVIVVDDDDRENEGDLVMAASRATTEKMAFMIRYCCGIVCAPIEPSIARRHNLEPMVASNDAPLGTAFTVSVDYRYGLTTGISAEERVGTVRALANPNCGAGDFVRPGHIFPLIAREGGVLQRSGHTEAAVDLAALAGLEKAAVICELVNDDGSVKRLPELLEFAKEHKLKIVSIADLIEYRQRREQLVERVSSYEMETPAGAAAVHIYGTPFDEVQHMAIVVGDISDGADVPARIHREQPMPGLFASESDLTEKAFARIKNAGRGVFILLRDTRVFVPQKTEQDTTQSHEQERHESWREVGVGAQILKDLNISSIRLLASQERVYVGLSGFGIDIVDTEILQP